MTKFRTLELGHHGAQDGNETNFLTIDVSGTANFSGTVKMSAGASIAGSMYVDGSVLSLGPIRSGAAASRGRAILVQRVTILPVHSAGAPALLVLPSGSDILDFYVDVEAPFAAGALVSAAEVLISAAGGVLLARINVSASTTRYGTMQNAQAVGGGAFRNVTATIEAHTSMQGLASALTAGQAMLSVIYAN